MSDRFWTSWPAAKQTQSMSYGIPGMREKLMVSPEVPKLRYPGL